MMVTVYRRDDGDGVDNDDDNTVNLLYSNILLTRQQLIPLTKRHRTK
jgi:hypothetical protein